MELQNFRKDADYFSGKLSEINRQLIYAGIATIWIFNTADTTVNLPKELLLPLFLFFISLFFDLLHYLIGSITWISFHRHMEKKGHGSTDDVKADPILNYPINAMWGMKIIATIVSYILLLIYLHNLVF